MLPTHGALLILIAQQTVPLPAPRKMPAALLWLPLPVTSNSFLPI
nr:MAG TPA: hypothetical protein [Caudoviricetes sp.]